MCLKKEVRITKLIKRKRKLLSMTKVVILAGGLGTRLQPITDEIPKPLIPINGKTLTEHVIAVFKKVGVTEFILSIGHKREMIKKYFGDGSDFNSKISYIEETEPLGTGGWLNIAQEKMPDLFDEDFYVCNGDNLFAIDLEDFMLKHKASGAVVSDALTKVDDPTKYGIVALDKNNFILQFLEKPKKEDAPSEYANAGYYIFSPKMKNHIPSQTKFMLERDVFPVLAEQKLLLGVKSDAQFFDTGTFEAWERVVKEWKQ